MAALLAVLLLAALTTGLVSAKREDDLPFDRKEIASDQEGDDLVGCSEAKENSRFRMENNGTSVVPSPWIDSQATRQDSGGPEAPWLVSSGALHHVTGDVNQLIDYTPTPGDYMGPKYMPVLGKTPEIIEDRTSYVSRNNRGRAHPTRDTGASQSWIYDSGASQSWIYDSGASQSSTGNMSLLKGFHHAERIVARVANGQTNSSSICGFTSGLVNLDGVRYFPGSPNIISAGQLSRQFGCDTRMRGDSMIITKDNQTVGIGGLHKDNVWYLYALRPLGSICGYCRYCRYYQQAHAQ